MKNYFIILLFVLSSSSVLPAYPIKEPEVAGYFYPKEPVLLSSKLDEFLKNVSLERKEKEKIFCIISPHAGYDYSGKIAAWGYKAVKDKFYKTVVILGQSHYYYFEGASVYSEGAFRTPLGDVEIDQAFSQRLIPLNKELSFNSQVFRKEHSIEVQIPFLQKVLKNFKIVPILIGKADFKFCQRLADSLVELIKEREDVLVVCSTDMYHGYDWQEAEIRDKYTLRVLEKMNPKLLYEQLKTGRVQLCGGLAVVVGMLTAKRLGYDSLKVLKYTNSAFVTGQKKKGFWTVGYSSCIITKKERKMLTQEQRKKLLKIARDSIRLYLKERKYLSLEEKDPALLRLSGAFVTLTKQGRLRGCIGRIIADKPLCEVIRDMAVEAGFNDPRFPPLREEEFKDIKIEISVLSPLKRIKDIDQIEVGKHGLLIQKGFYSGLLLPQVATEYGWDRIKFLEETCYKAGLPKEAWKDKDTQIYIFSAEVFSE